MFEEDMLAVRHHELLKPDKFDGTGCLKTFLKKFEICAMYNQWSMDDRIITNGKKVNVVSSPGQTVKVGGKFNKKFFFFALNDADLKLKVRNMQDTTENRVKAVKRQINALRQSVDVLQDH
ncbi:hypothetical protein HELRODRAFT_165403 [Helobdella robusta]|uniref:Uncharacterized protein n=1 Tax=Helobdella robusta TaxID=6412 RepID=T1EWQ4_HELRO|nr:hypothetical protein HELRODRAFT_165403 [Helobdella robusta]ESN91374.1 hypothetical protein HELRODRAFT_165403 [Helobdella robusta]